MKKVSVVIPCFNEENCIDIFYNRAREFFNTIPQYDYELIFVNDGSKDKTEEKITAIAIKDKRVKLINLSRNFGQMGATACGFKYATGDCIAEIDADLQDPIEMLGPMIKKWEEGFQVVHGVRKKRKGESWFKKVTSKIFCWAFNLLCKNKVQLDSGDFKLYDRKVLNSMITLPEKDKCFRFIVGFVGFKQCNVEFERNERVAGKTKWTTKKLINLASNTIIANSNIPLFIGFKVGMVISFISSIVMTIFTTLAIFRIFLPVSAWLFPFIGILFSIAFMLNGITNAYIDKIYAESKNRPDYIVDTTVNFD